MFRVAPFRTARRASVRALALAALACGTAAVSPPQAGAQTVALSPSDAHTVSSQLPFPGRASGFRPTRVRTYPGWKGMPESRFRVTEPLFAERIASMAERSSFVRARLEAIRRSGLRVWVTTPEALQVEVPGAAMLRAGWATMMNGGRDAVAVIDLPWLRGRRAAGDLSEEQMLADLDLLIGHELFVHIGSIGPGRDLDTMCSDPEPVPGAVGCSVVEENLLTFSLDPARPFRPDYRQSPLRMDEAPGAAADVPAFTSLFYPELEARGWDDTPLRTFVRASPGVREDTPLQHELRALWERGARERVDSLVGRFIAGVQAGRPQDAVEREVAAELAAAAPLGPEDRFRVRELELVRAGKHDRAREMVRRRFALIGNRGRVSMARASERVLREVAHVTLAPETFSEALEGLYQRGEWDRVRGVYGEYLRALAAGEGEAAVRRRLTAGLGAR